MLSDREARSIITPEAFAVAPELLGLPLARPWRRAAAMAIDLVLIALLSQIGWAFLGLALGLFLVRLAWRPAGGTSRRRRRLLAAAGVSVLAATLAWTIGSIVVSRLERPEGVSGQGMGLVEAGSMAADVLRIVAGAETPQELQASAARLASRLESQGQSEAEIRETLEELADENGAPWARDVVRAALDARRGETGESADGLAVDLVAALVSGETARLEPLREQLGRALAADLLAEQQARLARLERENRKLVERVRAAEERGLLSLLVKSAEDLGFGVGWGVLYFTAFLVWWRGQTPGKRLLRTRVVRLDGNRLGLWAAFSRFGGYAASLFTGMLGFFEILWDRNRQAIHDKIASTVVVYEPRRPAAAVASSAEPPAAGGSFPSAEGQG